MFKLYTSYFIDGNPERQQELSVCLQKNIQNQYINKIYLLLDQSLESHEIVEHEKTEHIYLRSRPTYNTIFSMMRKNQGDNDYGIIANSDIYFDESIREIHRYNQNTALALTRWEVNKNNIQFLNRKDSQDSWIIKGKPRIIDGDFGMGIPGCDNAIANRLEKAGYLVINPSLTIKTYHMHQSGKRNYDVNVKVPMPYKLIVPSK